MAKGWKRHTRSHILTLERDLEIAIRKWLRLLSNSIHPPDSANESLHDLYLRNRSTPRRINNLIGDIGKHLRRTAQIALESPTLPKKYYTASAVVILGAGASADEGMPCTVQLFNAIKRKLRATWKEISREYGWCNDAENLISALETAIWASWAQMQEDPRERRWLKKLLHSYREVLVDCQNEARRNPAIEQPSFKLIHHLHRLHKNNWSAISFNQDTVFEYALKNTGWDPRKGGWGLHFDSSVRNSIFAPLHPPRVLKPHGCIAWTRDHGKYLIGSTDIDEKTLQKYYPTDKINKNKIPLILAPSYLKEYNDLTIWHTMARVCHELIHATHIRVIGFQLRPDDTLASHVIRTALRLNRKRGTFELVGPYAASYTEGSMGASWSGVATALASRGWKIKCHPVEFKYYVKNCMLGRCDPICR